MTAPHGIYTRYTARPGCRCDKCKAAKATYQREYRAKAQTSLLVQGIQHGKAGYTEHKCRCRVCVDAKRVEDRKRAEKRRASMTPVEWQEPPQTRTGWSKWAGVAEQLRSRPGQWALIEKATTKAGLSGNINSGRIIAFEPRGAFEAVQRHNDDGTRDVYARYIGEPS